MFDYLYRKPSYGPRYLQAVLSLLENRNVVSFEKKNKELIMLIDYPEKCETLEKIP